VPPTLDRASLLATPLAPPHPAPHRPWAGLRWLFGTLLPGRAARGRGTQLIPLAQDAVISLRPGRGGLVLSCRSGLILVTQAGDLRDHVLEPGQAFRAHRRGLVVAWALRTGVVERGQG